MLTMRGPISARPTSRASKDHLRLFTKVFPLLRGYIILAYLPFAIAGVMSDLGWYGRQWAYVSFIVSLFISHFASREIARWYDSKFGLVILANQNRGAARSLIYVALVFVAIQLAPAALIRLGVVSADSWILYQPWSAILGVIAVVFGFRLRPYLQWVWVAGLAIVVLSLLPLGQLLGVPNYQHPLYLLPGKLLLALLITAYGFTAHRVLVNELKRFSSMFALFSAGADVPQAVAQSQIEAEL